MRDKRSMRLHSARLGRAARASVAAAGLLGVAVAHAAAAWPAGVKSKTALLATGPIIGGFYQIGFAIRLAPGVVTYWRDPGDAGVPTVFDFAGSTNIASVKVSYPAPTRIMEAGAATFGYRREVVFPITAQPADPSKPIALHVAVHYATCDSLCVPAQARKTLALSPDAPTSAEAASLIQKWRARVPKPLPPADAPVVKAVKAAGKPLWRVAFPGPGEATDLFVEGPKDWYFDSGPAKRGGFVVALAQRPLGGRLPVSVRLTLLKGSRSFQTRVELDESPAGG